MDKSKEQLLTELGFSEELIAKMNDVDRFLDFTNKNPLNFNCITTENEDFSEIIIDKVEQPFVSSLNYSE